LYITAIDVDAFALQDAFFTFCRKMTFSNRVRILRAHSTFTPDRRSAHVRLRIAGVVLVVVVVGSGLACPGSPVESAQPLGGNDSSDAALHFRRSSGNASDANDASRMADILRNTVVPERDPVDLAIRLGKTPADALRVARTTPVDYRLGRQETFRVADQANHSYFQTTATLRYVTAHLYMWVQNGSEVCDADLKRSADRFENQTYPTDRRYFGSEWSPGVDDDVRVSIFNGHVPGVGGYYSSSDELGKAFNRNSNEKELFYVNLDSARPGTDLYDGILAHEFQHMIHWNNDRTEPTWVNEGMSELAAQLNGFNSNYSSVRAFAGRPDTQLTGWADDPNAAVPNYGATHSFMNYLLKRFGIDLVRTFAADKDNSMASLNKLNRILSADDPGVSADDVFADWVVSNFLGAGVAAQQAGLSPASRSAGPDGRYGIRLIDSAPAIAETYDAYPVDLSATIHEYAANYIDLRGSGDLEIDLQGAPTAKLTNIQPHSGIYECWSNRGDNLDTTLTHSFDLTALKSASLSFWTWYDIENTWDVAAVEVSTDGGLTWNTLKGTHSVDANATGNSIGWTYTGVSAGINPQTNSQGNSQPVWLHENVDLTPWAGQKILLRFEYITDDAVNHPGFCVDDISIPELHFRDSAESDAAGWNARGFVRSDNVVPQRYIVQLIEYGPKVTVQRFDFPSSQPIILRGLGKDISRAVLAVSAIAPLTTETAPYHLTIAPLDAEVLAAPSR
jgi:immune inhibitor A